MSPYTHIVIASRLVSLVDPGDPPEYYWGAVAPDMRYLAAMRRAQTHLPVQRIAEYADRYPHRGSFLQGYLVHCLADQVDLGRIFSQHLPFALLKGMLTQRRLAVLLELYYLERQLVSPPLAGTHNEVLSELGLSESIVERFALAVQQYMGPGSQPDLLDLARLLGMEQDSRLEQYAAAAQRFQKSRLLKRGLFLSIRAGKIDEQIVSWVSALYRRSSGRFGW